jgi:hypothetical protein
MHVPTCIFWAERTPYSLQAGGLKGQAAAILAELGVATTSASDGDWVASTATHPADNVHWGGVNPGKSIGMAELLQEIAGVKQLLAKM